MLRTARRNVDANPQPHVSLAAPFVPFGVPRRDRRGAFGALVEEGTRGSRGIRRRRVAQAAPGVDLFLPNTLFLLPISPSSGIRRFVRGPSRHAGRSDRVNDGEDTPFNAPARPFHALVDQDLVGGRRRSAQPLALRLA